MRSFRPLVLVIAAVFVAAACSDSDAGPEPPFHQLVEPDRASEIIDEGSDDLVLLDIRTPDEFNQAKIDGAVNIDYYAADFRDRLAELDREVTYVVYCRTGNRTETGVQIMQELGFTRIYEIDGGIARWYEAGFPIG
jgi:rhodanese-related sulfurtransferase